MANALHYGPVGFYALALFLLLFLTASVFHAVWVVVVPARRPISEPVCEKCRYPVAGLGAPRCPECGADLLTAGILTPAAAFEFRARLPGALLALWLLWIAAAAGAWRLITTAFDNPVRDELRLEVVSIWLLIGAVVTWLVVRRHARLRARTLAESPARPG